MNLVNHNSFFGLDLMLRECRAGGELKKKGCCLAQIFLEHCGVKYDFLLGGKCVQFTSESLKVTVDYGCTPLSSTLEEGMLGKMGYAFVEASLISCAAMYAEGAISYS